MWKKRTVLSCCWTFVEHLKGFYLLGSHRNRLFFFFWCCKQPSNSPSACTIMSPDTHTGLRELIAPHTVVISHSCMFEWWLAQRLMTETLPRALLSVITWIKVAFSCCKNSEVICLSVLWLVAQQQCGSGCRGGDIIVSSHLLLLQHFMLSVHCHGLSRTSAFV